MENMALSLRQILKLFQNEKKPINICIINRNSYTLWM